MRRVLRAPKVRPAPRVPQDRPVHKGRRATADSKDLSGQPALKVLPVRLGPKVLLDLSVPRVRKAPPG